MTERDEDDKIPLIDGEIDLELKIPEIGKTYPIYGIITDILCESPVVIMVNNSIKLKCNITDDDGSKIKIIKDRAFEPGIFVATIEQRLDDGTYVGVAETIVFGKKKEGFDA